MPSSDHILIRRREYERIMAVVRAAERPRKSLVAPPQGGVGPGIGGGGRSPGIPAFITGNQTVEEVVQHSWQVAKWDLDNAKPVQDSDGFSSTVGADEFGRPAFNALNPAAVSTTGSLIYLRHAAASTPRTAGDAVVGHQYENYFWFLPAAGGIHRAKITTVLDGLPAGYNGVYDAEAIDDPSISVVTAGPVDRRPIATYINWHNKSIGDVVVLVEAEDGSLDLHACEQPHVEVCDDSVNLDDLTDVEWGLGPGPADGDLFSPVDGVWGAYSPVELGLVRARFFDAYDSVGDAEVSGTPAIVAVDTERMNTDGDLFSHAAGEITVAEADIYPTWARVSVGVEGDPEDAAYGFRIDLAVYGVVVPGTGAFGGSE